jgi:hypothetical protein
MLEKEDEKERRLYRLLGSLARVRILLFFLKQKGQKAYQRQIMYETGLTLNPIQRELANLTSLGILARPGLFFQTDVMADVHRQIETRRRACA